MISATTHILRDGSRNVVMQLTGISGGGDETNVVKVDVSELSPPPRTVKVTKITYDVSGGIVRLLWADDDPIMFADFTGQNIVDYSMTGGMTNEAGSGAGNTGDILLSTLGFDVGATYTVTLEMKKKFVP